LPYLYLGKISYYNKDYEKAKFLFSIANNFTEWDMNAYGHKDDIYDALGMTLLQMNKIDEAKKYFLKIVKPAYKEYRLA
jgi:tetratricopeptide (TPR) repeat protein